MVFEKLKEIIGGKKSEVERVEKEEKEVQKKKERKKISLEEAGEMAKEKKEETVQETKKELQPTLEKISNIREKINHIISDLSDAETNEEIHPNLYKSSSEALKLFLKKLNRGIDKIDIPEEPSWEELLDFNRTLQDANNLMKNASLSHGGQVAMLFKEKVEKFRRYLERLQDLSKELNTNLRKRNLELDDIDELLEKKAERKNLLEDKKELEEKIEELNEKKNEIQKDLEKKKSSLESLKKSDRFTELEDIEQEKQEIAEKKEKIRRRVESEISNLNRPLRKMSKLVERDEHMVSSEVLEALGSYLEKPFETVIDEEEGLPKLKAMLEELENLLEGKMKMSDRERRKRLDEVREITQENKIDYLRKKYFELDERKEKLEEERKKSSLLEKKQKLEDSINKKGSNLSEIKKEIKETREEISKVNKKIDSKTEEILEIGSDIFEIGIKID